MDTQLKMSQKWWVVVEIVGTSCWWQMKNNTWGKKLTKWHVNTMIENVDGNKEDIKWRYGSM